MDNLKGRTKLSGMALDFLEFVAVLVMIAVCSVLVYVLTSVTYTVISVLSS